MTQAALRQFSQVPYLELKFPPPFCCAYSQRIARAQKSLILAIFPRDKGFCRLRSDKLSFDFTFTERSWWSDLSKQPRRGGITKLQMKDNKEINFHMRQEKDQV